ncbi:hypothetical protein EAF04_008945 [Stromatinia cepivora]|nr:hypothetical protein EAF04_008945 [Stromatinia cepivora]
MAMVIIDYLWSCGKQCACTVTHWVSRIFQKNYVRVVSAPLSDLYTCCLHCIVDPSRFEEIDSADLSPCWNMSLWNAITSSQWILHIQEYRLRKITRFRRIFRASSSDEDHNQSPSTVGSESRAVYIPYRTFRRIRFSSTEPPFHDRLVGSER